MSKQRVYQLIRMKDGSIVKRLVNFQGAEKLERKMIQDNESKLWLYKHKYEYQDKKNLDKSSK